MVQNIKLLYILCLVFMLNSSISFATRQTLPFNLSWHIPVEPSGEESFFVPSLYFKGAVYSDSMSRVPVLIHRIPLDVPHFDYHFAVEEGEIGLCSPFEISILEESGFSDEDFVVYSDVEMSSGKRFSRFHLIPVRKKDGKYEKLLSFDLNFDLQHSPTIKSTDLHDYPAESVLANGNWYRMCVEKEGVYRIEKQDLVGMGINPSQLEKSTIQIYGNGGGMLPEANSDSHFTDLQENAIWVSGSGTGFFGDNDFILFYGQSPNRWMFNGDANHFEYKAHLYSNETCYFLTYDQKPGRRIHVNESLNQIPTHTVSEFIDYAHYERDLVNLIGSGKNWYGELFDVTLSREFEFNFPNILAQPLKILVSTASRSSATSSFTIDALGQSQTFNIAGVSVSSSTGIYARSGSGKLNVMAQGDKFNVKLTYNRGASGAQGWLDYITVNAKRQLVKTGDQMFFRNPQVVGSSNVSKYILSGINGTQVIWNVTDPLNVSQQLFLQNGGAADFTTTADHLKEFVIFSMDKFPKPRFAGKVSNQNLHALQLHDLTIVVPDLFRSEAERLAQFRREHDGLTVTLVSPQEIYNEFSSGVPDISAIRNFMKMFYDRASETNEYPRYLLLFGNGTYDNKNFLGYGGNFIPTFQTLQSLSPANSYISDDFFGLLDDSEGLDATGAIDLGIGRLPLRTLDEARFVVDKIIRYNQRVDGLKPGTEDPRFAGVISNYSDWRNVISLVADDEDGNVHFNQSELVAKYLASNHPVFNVEKIYLDAYEQTTLAGGSRYLDVNKAINNRVNQGALLINYIGHGGTLGLAHERILTFDDILSWGNYYNLPVFMTATCEFSSFDQPDANELSAGVRIFLKPDGGAAALFTTTRLAYSHSNFTLNDAFMKNSFIPMANGEMPRLGDLIRIAKVESSSSSVLKNFVLLGDPSMQMAYPKFKAITTQIPDTIRALEMVTIHGEVRTPQGTHASDYNGVIYPIIYDKKAVLQTLGNDPGSSVTEFELRNRIIYRGAASVTNGTFEFSFIVPRDINYSIGDGKISYYFDDGKQIDGCGYYDNFTIAGTSKSYTPDNTGPEISLYLNNQEFVSGDKTGPNPILLAILQDDSGINTAGQIGHDIVAFLNNDTSAPFILNSYYQTDLNSYKSGRVIYPFFNLEKGEYSLTLRAWDVHNNVSTASIDFIVTSAPGLQLTQLINKPNPFNERTTFSIQHNKPATELKIIVEIFSLNGQLVKSIEENVYASGFDVPPIEWDGTDNGGVLLQNGIYVFRAFVSSSDGDQVQRTEKLMILR
jgi:hypothetical protein